MTEKLVRMWGPADDTTQLLDYDEDGWLRACVDPVGFSYQVAANLPLTDDGRLQLLKAENCAIRLRLLEALVSKKAREIYGCSVCQMPLLVATDIFLVPGAEGSVGAYVNPHG